MTIHLAAPASRAELLACLSGPEVPTLVAGGTDILAVSGRLPAAGMLVDLGRMPEFDRIDIDANLLTIGAGATIARLIGETPVRLAAPALCQAAECFGSVQIRNRATIGGNIAGASAAADLLPALVAMRAEAEILSPGGACWISLEKLLDQRPVVPFRAALMAVRMPRAARGDLGAFVKLGRRQEPTIARLSLALAGPPGAARLFAGALAPSPRRLVRAETALNAGGAGFAEALVQDVGEAIAGRASLGYKSGAIRALAADLLARLPVIAGAA